MQKNSSHPHILITIATHGDERIGFRVLKKLTNIDVHHGTIEFQIANPKAARKQVRYIDQDLNRSFPGNFHGNYEQRLAAKLLPKIKKADIVIDIHSTTSELKDAIIVTKLDRPTKKVLDSIQPKYVLHMTATGRGPLIYNARVGLVFEYGKDNDPTTINKVVTDIKKILAAQHMISKKGTTARHAPTCFRVTKEFSKQKGDVLHPTIKNYTLVKKGSVVATRNGIPIVASESFYPILFGQKNYDTIFGFMGKKLTT